MITTRRQGGVKDMPYDAYGNEIPSKADKRTGFLSFGDIGGVGQLVYHNFRFAVSRIAQSHIANHIAIENDGKVLSVSVFRNPTAGVVIGERRGEPRFHLRGNQFVVGVKCQRCGIIASVWPDYQIVAFVEWRAIHFLQWLRSVCRGRNTCWQFLEYQLVLSI